jgi:hypothetical protein
MSNFFDFNTAQVQQGGDLLPAKTFARVVCAIRPGGHGDGGLLTKSQSGFEYLSLELTISSAPYAKRKIFQNAGVGGVTEGHEKAAEISRSLYRGMIESARGIDPKDESDKARRARVIGSFADLNELEFAIEIGIEKGKDGFDDKNKIQRVLTSDHKQYQRVMAGETVIPVGGNGKVETLIYKDSIPVAKPVSQSPIPAWAR